MAIETKKHAPLIYRVYDEIKAHVGKSNAISGKDLSAQFDISQRHLRDIIHEIRADETLTHLILSCNKGYYVPTKDEGAKDINRIMNQACSLFKIAHKLAKKSELDGQGKIALGDYFKPFVESYGEV